VNKMKKEVKDMWTVSTGNRKTGPIPTQYVGANRDETWESCKGCNLRPDADGGCYAWAGQLIRAANSVRKATERGRPARLADVLERTPRSSKAVRFGAIGDPSRVNRESVLADVKLARENGLKVIGYTHFWEEEANSNLKDVFLASCETKEQADEALSMGWLPSIAGPESMEGMITCPNYAKPEIQCNRCTLCDVETLRKTRFNGVVFPAHSHAGKKLPLVGQTVLALKD
jgi:hypothetical protein